jgi:uncharacterized protein
MSESQRSSHIGPVQARERIEFVDILRGFAILGILVANMAGYAGFATGHEAWTDPLDRAILILTRFLVEAKFYSLFSFLFGWGMAMQMARAKDRGYKFAPLWLRRMLILLIFGLIHGMLIWSGDILTLYALYGILLLPFGNRSEKTILISATLALLVSIVVTLPGGAFDAFRAWYEHATAFLRSGVYSGGLYASGTYRAITRLRIQECLWGHSWFIYTFGNIFGMFLLGLYAGRRRIFQEIDRHLPLVRRFMWAGLAIGVIFNGLYVLTLLNPQLVPLEHYRMVSRGARTIGAPALMLFYVSGIILLVQKDLWRQRLAPLASVGRMALTNYLLQSVVCTLIFYSYGLGLYGEADPLLGLILTIVVYLAQIRFSEWWLRRYRFGPTEWLWRTLTYGRFQPLRRGAAHGDHGLGVLDRLRRLAARVGAKGALVSVWVVLLLWAAALGVWYIHLEGTVTGAALSLELPKVQTEATATSIVTGASSVAEVHAGSVAEPQPESQATPVVEPVAYLPGPIAASGDLLALASTFDAVSALQQIETLAAPPFYGRYPASPGGWAAGEYIAAQFARYGLQPAGDAGTYFQAFPFEYVALAAMPNLIVEVPGGTTHEDYALYEDYSTVIRQYLGHGMASGDVVWANHCAPDDFDSLDAVDKIVLCRTPSLSDAGRNALEHGAAGLLLLMDPAQRPPDFGTTYYEPLVPQPIPAFLVYPPVVEELLAGSGLSLEDLSTSFTAFPLATRARIEVQTMGAEACPIQGCLGRNVLGVLPGRDRTYADQVIVIGAHYDHLGQAPDGTVWTGANDDASGVAILLELARTWHEQGYVPRQTVLFAAWDAEEEGLLGSTHYVLHPRYLLQDTVAMIQLDMVGAGGDTLWIDGEGELGEHLHAVAEALGIQTELTHVGRSDHVPFLEAGVPADLLIWRFDEEAQPQYHRPMDTPAIIETDKLQAVGQIAALTILGLSEGDSAIGDLLTQRTEAIEQDDLEAFLDTSSPGQRALDRLWFTDMQSLLQTPSPARFEVEALNTRVLGQTATATVRMTLEQAVDDEQDPQTLTALLEARFEHDGQAWRWAGPNLIWTEPDDGLAVAYPPGSESGLDGLGQHAARQYAELAAQLGLPAETEATLMLFPDTDSLRASTALSLPAGQDVWVSESTVKLAYRRDISSSLQLTDALAQLVLAEAGVTEASAPWLWQGLPLVLRAGGDPVVAQTEYLPRLQHLLAADSITPNKVAAWAAVSYIQQHLGWQGLGRFVADLGQACRDGLCENDDGLDHVLLNTLQLDAVSFESAWRDHWRGRLATAQAELDALLAARTEAILTRNETAFLDTVDPSVPGLLAEEQHWFVELAQYDLADFSLTGRPVVLLTEGGFVADVTLDYHLADADSVPWGKGTIPLKAHLTPGGAGVLWAGFPFGTLQGDGVQVLHAAGQEELAGELLHAAEALYPLLAGELEIEQPTTLFIKLYTSDQEFRAGISLAFPQVQWAQAWTGRGSSLKLRLESDVTADEYRPLLAVQMARHLLYQMGSDSEWLVKGASLYLAGTLDRGVGELDFAQELYKLLRTLRQGSPSTLEAMPPDYELSETELPVVQAQAWDTVRYLEYAHGREGLLTVFQNQAQGLDLDAALQAAIGQTRAEFEAAWVESLGRAHAPAAWIEVANDFDPERTDEHVAYLASPALAGRQAGSSGAEAAAAYIADRFSDYGLEPVGENGGFFQTFPLTYPKLLAAPRLEIVGLKDQVVEPFAYRQDYLLVPDALGGQGSAVGELIWVLDEEYRDMDLAGKIVLRLPSEAMDVETRRAAEHGASGLILIGPKQNDEVWAKTLLPPELPAVDAIPVLQLTKGGYERLLEAIGQTHEALLDSPPAQPLGIEVRVEISFSPLESGQTANVLGLLPGSDPDLAQEVIVLGAHYDHVGDDPPGGQGGGRRYPGANDDASGVAVLLEIARLWQAAGYQPGRSVLFAAWGAQELGELGSRYYVDHPLLPLKDTVAMLQLDTVGGGEGYYLEAQGGSAREGLLVFNLQVADEWVDGRLTLRSKWAQSDQIPFHEAGVPSLLITWREASEDNWPVEIADEVDPYRLGVTGRMVTLAVMATAR